MTYLDMMINALFTGIGTATGLWIFDNFLRKKADTIHEKVQKGEIKIPDTQNALDRMLGRKE